MLLHMYNISCSTCSSTPIQNEDLAAIASQLYYIEMGRELDLDRLARMLPTVIPDSCLAGPGMIEKWMEMVVASFRRVRHAVNSVTDCGIRLLYDIMCFIIEH